MHPRKRLLQQAANDVTRSSDTPLESPSSCAIEELKASNNQFQVELDKAECERRANNIQNQLHNHVVLERVFANLSAKDLSSCACVCRSFYHTAHQILKKRQGVRSFFFIACPSAFDTEMRKAVEAIRSVDIVPQYAIVFANDLLRQPDCPNLAAVLADSAPPPPAKTARRGLQQEPNIKRCLKAVLPASCELILNFSTGVIGTEPNGVPTMLYNSGTENNNYGPAFSMVLVSKSFGKPQAITFTQFLHEYTTDGEEHAFVPYPRTSGLILAFPHCPGVNYIPRDYHRYRLIVGAHQRDRTTITPSGTGRFEMPYILISSPTLEAKCIIIPVSANTTDDVDARLAAAKASMNFDGKHQIAFMFSAEARGRQYFPLQRDAELWLFRKHFPTTQVIGVFCDNELGIPFTLLRNGQVTYDGATESHMKRRNSFPNGYLRNFSTVILFIAFDM